MVKIKEFTIKNLHNEEDFGYQTLVDIETKHLTLEADQEMVRIYKVALLAYDQALKSSTRNSHTDEVVDVDSLTNTAWRGLHAQVKVMFKHPNKEYRKTGTETNNIMDKYGDITRMGYNEKYGCAKNLLQDLNTLGEEKQKQISIYDWVVELQTRYDEYIVSKVARMEEDSYHVTGLIKDTRDNADGAYRTLVERVNALALINGVEAYERFITNINVIIDEAHAVLASRKTRAKHDTEPTNSEEVELT